MRNTQRWPGTPETPRTKQGITAGRYHCWSVQEKKGSNSAHQAPPIIFLVGRTL